MFRESLLILLQSSSPTIMYYLHLYILIGRLLIGILASVQMRVTYKRSKSSPEALCSYLLYIYPQISMQQINCRFNQLPYLIYIGREVYIIFLPIYITSDYSLAKSVINLLQANYDLSFRTKLFAKLLIGFYLSPYAFFLFLPLFLYLS